MHPKLAPMKGERGMTNTRVGQTEFVFCRWSESQTESVESACHHSRANNSAKKANLAHRYLAEYQAIPALAAGWLGSDTKLDCADTNTTSAQPQLKTLRKA